MREDLPADLSPDVLLEFLGRNVGAQTSERDIAALFAGRDMTSKRIDWGGSGRWRNIVSTPEGVRAAFEYDVDDKLIAYGVMPASQVRGGSNEDSGDDPADGNFSLILVGS